MKKLLFFVLYHFFVINIFAQTANTYFVDIEHIHLFVKEYKHKSKKAPKLVFLHGGAGDNHLNFLPYCEALKANFHLYFYDQTDAGQSYTDKKINYAIDLEVENIEQLRKYWKIEKLNLVGHSWGSILALFYANKYPQNIEKIVLTGSIGTDVSHYQLFAQNLQKKFTSKDYQALQNLAANNAPRQDYLEKVMLKYYFADTNKIANMSKTSINFEVNQAISQDIFKNFSLKGKLHHLNFPILVLQGKQDLLSVAEIKEGFEGIKQVQFKEIDQAGHWAFVEQPEEFIEQLNNFLSTK